MAAIVENDIVDKDSIDESALAEKFSQSVYLNCDLAVSLNKNYISAICGSLSSKISTALSDNTIQHFSIGNNSINKVCKLSGHSQKITDIVTHNKDDHLIYSCSDDGVVKLWDTRTSGLCVQEYREELDENLMPFESLDLSANGLVMCASSQLTNNNAFLVFWDLREPKPLGGYWNSHTDDITKVRFHPKISDKLASCSSDGLLNIYNVSAETEDDSLEYSLNIENAIESIRWLDDTFISCVTQDNQVFLCNAESGDIIHSFSRETICRGIKRCREDDTYVIDTYKTKDDEYILLAGSYSDDGSCLRSCEIKKNKLKARSNFVNNKQIVRSCFYNEKEDYLVTAGESGILSLWKKTDESSSTVTSDHIIKSTKKSHSKRNKPY